tara:strand:- start:298 stop:594 length:297 start_codon:yes stop_codon:yes gene_type:complete
MTKTKEWLLYNAVLSWLSHYGGMGSEYTPQYQELLKEVEKNYEQSLTTKTQKRGRPAKRQRTKKATSNTASTKKSEKIPYENQKEVDAYMKQRTNQEA